MKTLDQDFPPLAALEQNLRGLELLRKPFPAHHISKLPKGTKAQNECAASEKINCKVCGGWHHPKIIHLDYVGHAALTDRLLDADPFWTWEPMALRDGLPAFDETGGLWIRLTVCGQTRIGYGHAMSTAYKDIGSREKEVIGDALRNAAMRFGAALDLWHKGDLHIETEDADIPSPEWMTKLAKEVVTLYTDGEIERAANHVYDSFTDDKGVNNDQVEKFWSYMNDNSAIRSGIKAYRALTHAATVDALATAWAAVPKHSQEALKAVKDKRKAELQPIEAAA